MLDAAGAEPLVELRHGPLVGEVGTPERRVLDPGLGEARGEVQEPDEPREVAGPVRDDENRSAVGAQAREHVVAVLPDRLDDDERGIRRQRLEHLDARALAVDEAVSGHRVDAVAAFDRPAESLDGGREVGLEPLLRRPALHVGAEAEVAGCHGVDRVRRGGAPLPLHGKGVLRHDSLSTHAHSRSSSIR